MGSRITSSGALLATGRKRFCTTVIRLSKTDNHFTFVHKLSAVLTQRNAQLDAYKKHEETNGVSEVIAGAHCDFTVQSSSCEDMLDTGTLRIDAVKSLLWHQKQLIRAGLVSKLNIVSEQEL